jgi:hypothetical protein
VFETYEDIEAPGDEGFASEDRSTIHFGPEQAPTAKLVRITRLDSLGTHGGLEEMDQVKCYISTTCERGSDTASSSASISVTEAPAQLSCGDSLSDAATGQHS